MATIYLEHTNIAGHLTPPFSFIKALELINK